VETLLSASEGADVVVAHIQLETGVVLGHQCEWENLRSGNWFHPSACLLRREALQAVGGFPSAIHEDWELWQRLYTAGARFACVHEVTNIKGVHSANRTGPRL
jgi:GT2 family glycosyltransferase